MMENIKVIKEIAPFELQVYFVLELYQSMNGDQRSELLEQLNELEGTEILQDFEGVEQ